MAQRWGRREKQGEHSSHGPFKLLVNQTMMTLSHLHTHIFLFYLTLPKPVDTDCLGLRWIPASTGVNNDAMLVQWAESHHYAYMSLSHTQLKKNY